MAEANQGRYAYLQGKRLTIGLLSDRLPILPSYTAIVLRGVLDKAREHDVNILCFVGGVLRSPVEHLTQENVLYDLVGKENVAGLLVVSGTLSSFVEPAEFAAFCGRYHPLPTVSIGRRVAGVPSVTVENYAGMYQAVAHLITVHGYRRIAFIRGPEENLDAEERYRAYRDALTAHGLPVDMDLVTPPGDFRLASGEAAVTLLWDQRRLNPEALVAANDDMALAALDALYARGCRVPQDVAVVGFDDLLGTEYLPTPLTTVRQPMYEMGQRAVEILLAQLAGEQVPEEVRTPVSLVVRQSCGCLDSAVAKITEVPERATPGRRVAGLKTQRSRVLTAMAQAVGSPESTAWVKRLWNAFLADLENGSSDEFLRQMSDVLQQMVIAGGDVRVWREALLALRRYALPHLTDEALVRAADLWQQAQTLIGETVQQMEAYQALRFEQHLLTIGEMGQDLITTFSEAELVEKLAKGLPALDIPSACLSLYEDPMFPTGWLRPILAYNEKGRIPLDEGHRIPSSQLMLLEVLPERRYSYIIEPLSFREHQLGIALFEMGPQEGGVYEALREDISSALGGARLLQERERAQKALEEAYAEVERQVKERTAQLQREIAERERAQEENLRLQQEVIEAQQRAIRELSAPIIPVLEGVIVMPLIGSIDTLRARDVTRALLAGIREHRAKVVILDITGVPIVDSGVAAYLNKTIQAARLKGARTIVTGVSEAVAETIVDLGIDWSGIETLSDLRTGLRAALAARRTRA